MGIWFPWVILIWKGRKDIQRQDLVPWGYSSRDLGENLFRVLEATVGRPGAQKSGFRRKVHRGTCRPHMK